MEPTSLQTLGDKDLYDFLMNCPKDFHENERIRKYQLKNGDYIHCVLWNFHFYVSGTDIVKILIWRFQNAGRQIGAIKKFEEGIFSDLRNLKPGVDATLEGPRSEFLEFLYKNGCIRTQKKQKVFYWYSVPHDELFFDALERDIRRDSSIYAYNRLVQDPQHIRMSENNNIQCYPKFNNSVAPTQDFSNGLFNNSNSNQSMTSKGVEPMQSRDIFNIKDALFSDNEAFKSKHVDLFGSFKTKEYGNSNIHNMEMFGNGNKDNYTNLRGMKDAGQPKDDINNNSRQKSNIFDPQFTGIGDGARSSSAYNSVGVEDIFNEGLLDNKSQRVKKPIEKALDFDDFDLGQFDFLKERCKEHFSRKNDNCEQKLFEENGKDDKITSIDRIGEIRFIGSQDRN